MDRVSRAFNNFGTVLLHSISVFLCGRGSLEMYTSRLLNTMAVDEFYRHACTLIWVCMIDQISVMMLVVVSTISFMVHLYSRGYMKGDPGYTKFFRFFIIVHFFHDGTGIGRKPVSNLYLSGSW